MAALRPRGAASARRGPGTVMVGMVALICLAAGYLLGNSSRWAEASTQASEAGTAAELQQEPTAGATGVDAAASSVNSGSSTQDAAAAGGAGGGAGVKTVCEDTCPGHAKNGVCNDGRPTPENDQTDSMTIFEVLCDLGTDCSDCGPWVRMLPAVVGAAAACSMCLQKSSLPVLAGRLQRAFPLCCQRRWQDEPALPTRS